MRKLNIVLCFLVVIVVLSGCIKIPIGDGQTLKLSKDGITLGDSEGKETNIAVDKDDESISMSNEDGESWDLAIGEDVELPEDFPTHYLPIPKGADIVAVNQSDMEGNEYTTVSYQSEGEAETLADMYVESLEKNDFDLLDYETYSEEVENMGFLPIQGTKDDMTYIIQIIDAEEDGTQVMIMYGKDHEE